MTHPRLRGVADRARYQARIWQALSSGPPFRSALDRIIIDLTHHCDLACQDCNRSCGLHQAAAPEFIGLDQVERFVRESVAVGRRWRRIMLEGGEPTLHPQLDGILDALRRYRHEHCPECEIQLCTNGHGEAARRARECPPAGIRIKDSAKSAGPAQGHFAFNVAPADLAEFAGADYGQGCYIHRIFGLGLTRTGYYPHPVCGGIDRVFGFDVGLKSLPASPDDMTGQMRRLCPLCGHFREFRRPGSRSRGPWLRHQDGYPPGSRSSSWVEAYRSFGEKRPILTPY